MASEIRVNQIQSRTGVSTISFTETGPIISGVTTVIGDLDVTGLISYDDVTNIDSVGVVTARDGLHVTGGSVGIGTDNPDSIFHLESSVPRFTLSDTGTNAHHRINADSSVGNFGFEVDYDSATSTPAFFIKIKGDEKLRTTSSGSVGIGTITPGAKLEVFDETSNTIINVKSGDSGAVLNLIDDSARSSIEQNGTTLKIISDTGAEHASSDIRLQVDGSTKMLVDSYGCIRVGNTHAQTTSGNTKRIALGAKGSIWGWTSGNINGALTLADNYYWDGGNNRAIEADNAAYLSLRSGTLRYGTTDSTPSAGGVTGLTEKFRVDTSGNLLLGQGHTTASDLTGGFTKRLAVEGTSAANSSIGLTRNANDDNPPYIYFGKSRGTSAGSNTRALNGDHLGMVNFAGSKGTGAFGDSVNLRVNAEENFSSSSTPGRFSVWTTPTNSTSPQNSFQVNSAGAVTAPRNVAWSYRRVNSASWGSASSGVTYGGLQYRTPLPLFGSSATDYDTHNALSTFTSGPGTGIKFTAPVGGKYMVTLNMTSVRNNTNADWGSIGLMVNTTAQASTGSLDYMLDTMYYPDVASTNNQLGWGGSVIINLSANDYIVPYTMSVENFYSDNQFFFQGYLLG